MKFKLYLPVFLAVCGLSLLFAAPEEAEAKKRYRYIKRMHGTRVQWNITPFQRDTVGQNSFLTNLDLDLAYSYNHKGWFEFGPAVSLDSAGGFAALGFSAALFAEYNFIKNRGKRKHVPAAGLQIGAAKAGGGTGFALEVSPYFSYKHFVAKRTALIATLGYKGSIPFSGFSNFMGSLTHSSFFVGGFSYYFDFY